MKKQKNYKCIGENPYWSGYKCSGFRLKKTKLEEKQDGKTDGIPPKPKVLGILPTII